MVAIAPSGSVKILQVVPADPGWVVLFNDDTAYKMSHDVVLWGLGDDGAVYPFADTGDGYLENVAEDPGFKRLMRCDV